jgi:hypothetical protein
MLFVTNPRLSNRVIRLEPDLADAEISASAVTANALNLLRRAAETGGLKLTATGNLSRVVVEEKCGTISVRDVLCSFRIRGRYRVAYPIAI